METALEFDFDLDLELMDQDFGDALRVEHGSCDDSGADDVTGGTDQADFRDLIDPLGAADIAVHSAVTCNAADRETPHPLIQSAAAYSGMCIGVMGVAACLVGVVTGIQGLLAAHGDATVDLVCAGAWLSAGAAGISMAVWLRRVAVVLADEQREAAPGF